MLPSAHIIEDADEIERLWRRWEFWHDSRKPDCRQGFVSNGEEMRVGKQQI